MSRLGSVSLLALATTAFASPSFAQYSSTPYGQVPNYGPPPGYNSTPQNYGAPTTPFQTPQNQPTYGQAPRGYNQSPQTYGGQTQPGYGQTQQPQGYNQAPQTYGGQVQPGNGQTNQGYTQTPQQSYGQSGQNYTPQRGGNPGFRCNASFPFQGLQQTLVCDLNQPQAVGAACSCPPPAGFPVGGRMQGQVVQ